MLLRNIFYTCSAHKEVADRMKENEEGLKDRKEEEKSSETSQKRKKVSTNFVVNRIHSWVSLSPDQLSSIWGTFMSVKERTKILPGIESRSFASSFFFPFRAANWNDRRSIYLLFFIYLFSSVVYSPTSFSGGQGRSSKERQSWTAISFCFFPLLTRSYFAFSAIGR